MGEGGGGGEHSFPPPLTPLPPGEGSFMVTKGEEKMTIEEFYLLEFTGAE